MKEIIRFNDTSSDLRPSPEQWRIDSIKDRRERIFMKFQEVNHCLPRPTMKIFRVGIINILQNTMIEDLVLLSDKIRNEFMYDCFQIAIYRKKGQAHLLFDCFDYVNCITNRIHVNKLNRFYALIVSSLQIPINSNDMEPLLRYFLIRYYHEDKNVFTRRLEHLKHVGLSPDEYEMEYIIHNYVEAVCQGRLK